MHGASARNVSVRRNGPRPEMICQDLLGQDRIKTEDA